MRRIGFVICAAVLIALPIRAQSLEEMTERLDEAGKVFTELLIAPDADVPAGLLEDAGCVVVIPGVRRTGFGFGGQRRRGAGTRRSAAGAGRPPR